MTDLFVMFPTAQQTPSLTDYASLLPVTKATFAGEEQLCVNMRNVHSALGVGRDFATWIKDRISKYGFEEHQDYEIFSEEKSSVISGSPNLGSGNHAGFQGRIEYYFTLDAAKEIAMVENNEKGREIRKYFIACEKQLRNAMPMPKDYASALRALADSWEREQQERQARLAAEAEAKEKTETLAIVSNELDIANDQLGYAREFRSCIAMGEELSMFFDIANKDFAGDSFYGNMGKFMVRLSKGQIVPGITFEVKKDYVPNARYNWINVYSVAAWDYFFNMCQRRQISKNTKFVGKYWRG